MLRVEREKRGWDQAELARHIDVRQQTVSRWEAGTSRPKRSMVTTLAALFGAEDIQQWLDAAGYPDPTADTPDEPNRPVRPLLTVLPLDRLSPEAFEQFCRDLVTDVYPGSVVHRFGGPGHKQDGIDLYAELPDGEIYTYQCKRHQRFGPEMVHQAVADSGVAGNRHHLLLSRVATPAARKAIADYPNWRLWDVEDISRTLRRDLEPGAARQLVETYFPGFSGDFLGLPEPGPWVTADNFFRPYDSRGRTFSHAWTLVGRSRDLRSLLEFISARDRQVAILSGRGGSGKSRLLKELAAELARRSPTTAIRFLLPGVPIKLSDVEQLPRTAQLLVVVDDAHDTDELPVLLSGMSYHRPNAKILLATRPYGAALIQATVARVGLTEPVLHTLQDLTREDAEELATEILAAEDRDPTLASRIADVTWDSPLMTVVGASLVAKDALDPRLLASHQDFRQQLLARFHDIVVGGWAEPAERMLLRTVLQLVALLQPVRDVDEDFRTSAAAIISAPFDTISRQLRALEDAGVLLGRGGRLRVVPDLLADYIVADACFAESSRQPTGYADRVFHEVHGESARHLLINLSKLDWRMATDSGLRTSLLDRVWAIITERFRSAGIFRRADILKEIAPVAFYQPRRALDLAHLALEEPTDDIDEPYDRLFPETRTTYAEVERELGPVLRNVAYNFEHLFEACDLLWRLAQRDESHSKTSFDSPIKVLQELASLDRRKPLAYSERVVDCALQWLSQRQPENQIVSPFDILDQALATEGTESTTKEFTVTLTPYYVKAEAVRALRQRVIDAAFDALTGGDLSEALRAAATIETALRYPIGRNTTDDLRDQWATEFLPVLKRLRLTVAASPLDPVLLHQIRKAVRWHATRAKGPTGPHAQAVLDAIPDTVENRLTRVLIDPWEWSSNRSADIEEFTRRSMKWQDKICTELTTRYSTHDLALLVEERLKVLTTVRRYRDSSPGIFTRALVTASKDLGVTMIDRIIARPDSPLREILDAALAATASVDAEDAIRLARRLLSFNDVDLHRRIAFAYGRGLGHRTNLSTSEIELIKELAAHQDAQVRKQIVYAIDNLAATDPDGALKILVGIDFGTSTRLADETLSMFSPHHVFDVQNLTSPQLNPILGRLRTLPSLDGHWIGEFLGALSPVAPQQVLALLTDRITLAGDQSLSDYHPIPHGWDERSPLRFRETDAFEVVLRNIRNWAADAANAPERHYWSPILFAAAANGFDGPVLDVLNEWITSPRREEVETISNLVREAPSEFIVDQSDFTIRLLDTAWRHGRKTYERVARTLYNTANSGMRVGTIGEPFPQDVKQRDNARTLANRLPTGSPAHQFFRDLTRSAEQRIRQEMELDEDIR